MSTPALATPAAPIGFRPEGPAGGVNAGSGLLVAAALLAAATVALVYAKRRGWLRAWVADDTTAVAAQSLCIASRLRLSPRTVVYEVVDGERRFHVVESTAQVVVQRDP
jgi:hypothetical protein